MCKLTEEQLNIAKELYAAGETYHDVSVYLKDRYDINISSESLRYYVTRRDKPKVTLRDKLNEDGIEKVLVLSDLHCPYHSDYILDIVGKHKDEINTLILGGDIIDCYNISSFPKLDPKPLHVEMAECHRLLKEISDLIPDVKKILILGNHEQRWKKYLGSAKSEVNSLHSDNILYEITKGFEVHDRIAGVTTIYEPLDYEVIDNWFIQYNDCVVAHPTSFSKVAAKTSQMSLDYFKERDVDFNVVLIAHTHKISSCMKYGKHAFEIGCTCKPQGYAESGKLTYTQQCNGYYLAVFRDNKFDVNESRQYVL